MICPVSLQQTFAVETLGRLFFTPDERLKIEQMAQRSQAEMAQNKAKSKRENDMPQWLKVNGLVIREGHDNVIWINDKQNLKQAGIHIDSQHLQGIAIPVQFLDRQTRIQLKPGQQFNTHSGEILENFQSKKRP